jgi:tRNA U38,U39,U40 pseudouridine synthase TruA
MRETMASVNEGRYAPAARTVSGVSAANTVTALEAPVSTPS